MEKSISELLEFCIININKPSGLTSHDVVEKIKKILDARRVGHTGTLDPKVTGVLPVLINRACKLSDYFMKKDKEYVGKMKIHSDINEDKLKKEMNKFIGKIMQKPPVKSRVKRVERERIVNKFELIRFDEKKRIAEFCADVEAGTYIRKLISDLGERIGGAHMIELMRVKAGLFEIDDSVSLEEVELAVKLWREGNEENLRKILIPAEIIREIVPAVEVNEFIVERLLNGSPLRFDEINQIDSDLISVFNEGSFIGIYKKYEKDFKPEFVKN